MNKYKILFLNNLTKKIIYFFCFINIFSCKNTLTNTENSNTKSTEYAQNFTIEKHPNYSILKVKNPWKSADISFTYVVYDKGNPKPEYSEKAIYIQRPVERVACTSTTHIALLNALNVADKLVGISGAKYVYNERVRERIASGKIREIGTEAGLNYEVLIDTEPDIVFTYGMSADNNISKLREAGLTPVVLAEYMDHSPLGRAEWMKFVAVIMGKKAEAMATFDTLAANYNELKTLVKKATSPPPSVLVGMGLSGNWYVPGGESYVAQHIADAGGNYLWKDSKGTASLQPDFEIVYEKARNVDKWINIGLVNSAADIIAADERYADFKALKNKELYNGSKRKSPEGGYDIYESAVVHPDLVLKDLIKAFHPNLLTDYEFYYYERVD